MDAEPRRTELVLVRHAYAAWSEDEGRPLTAKGRADAERLAGFLLRLEPTHVFSSPYARARQTVAPLAARAGLEVGTEEGLRERRLARGPVDGFSTAVAATWRDFDFAHPGGESNRMAQRRIVAAVARIAARCEGGRVVVGTHGNALALYLNALDVSVGFKFWSRMTTPDVFVVQLGEVAGSRYRRLSGF